MTTVLIADDQPMQRFGFRMLLESQDDMTVVGEASNGTEAVRLVDRHHPDVVLMDIRMPGLDGIEATRRIITTGARTRVLIVTTFDLDEYAYDGLRAGASGFLVKDAQPEELLAGIRAVASGDAVVAPSLTRRLLDAYIHHLPQSPGSVRHGPQEPSAARIRVDTVLSAFRTKRWTRPSGAVTATGAPIRRPRSSVRSGLPRPRQARNGPPGERCSRSTSSRRFRLPSRCLPVRLWRRRGVRSGGTTYSNLCANRVWNICSMFVERETPDGVSSCAISGHVGD